MTRVRRVSVVGLAWPTLPLVALALALPASLSAQPHIDHPGLECIEPGKYAVILSGIDPETEVQTAKLYFRSSLYPDFYYVEMTYQNGRFHGILPKPSPETTQVIYYLEAVDNVFNGTRSIEWDPLVDECDDDPALAYFTGEEPEIVVGATSAGQSPLPAGFSAAGIVGTITSMGVSSGLGGGVGAGTAIGVGAAAAGAAGAVVATSGQTADPAPEPVASPDPTTTIGPGTTTTTIRPSTTTTTIASTTTTVSASSTTTVPSSTSTTSTVSTTSSPSTTPTTAPPLNADCFDINVLGECRVEVNATCVSLPIDRYDWILDIDDRWQRVDIVDGPIIVLQNWSGSCGEDDRTLRFQLTVHRGSTSHTSVKSKTIPGNDDLKTPPDATPARARLESYLAVPPFDGSAQGRVVVNEAFTRVVDSSQPVMIEFRGVSGASSVVGTVTRGTGKPGHWRFDLRHDPHFARGSLRVIRGNVLALEPDAIVFRLDGHTGERVELTFERRP